MIVISPIVTCENFTWVTHIDRQFDTISSYSEKFEHIAIMSFKIIFFIIYFQVEEEEIAEIEQHDSDENETNYGTLNKSMSRSLPELNKVDNTKRNSVLLDPAYLADSKKRQRKHNFLEAEAKSTHLSHSLPKRSDSDHGFSGISRYNTMQNPQIYIHSLKERGINFGDNSDGLSQLPIARFNSLHDLNNFQARLPRATSIERIPIDNARKFKDCNLTEISPGCFLVPIADNRKNRDESNEMKVYY